MPQSRVEVLILIDQGCLGQALLGPPVMSATHWKERNYS